MPENLHRNMAIVATLAVLTFLGLVLLGTTTAGPPAVVDLDDLPRFVAGEGSGGFANRVTVQAMTDTKTGREYIVVALPDGVLVMPVP